MTDNILDLSDDTQTDANKDYLAELTKPGGKFDRSKYKDDLSCYQAIARGKVEGDTTVDQFKMRLDELREDYTKVREENVTRAKLEEVLDKLTSRQQLASSEKPIANEDDIKPTIDLKQINDLVSSRIRETEAQKKASENVDLVVGKLKERFGSNFKATVTQQINELGITEDDFNEMARSKPKFLLRTLGMDTPVQRENFQSPLTSQQRADGFAPSVKKRDWDYYETMRKTDPALYHDRNTYVQIQKDLLEQGEDAFYKGR